MKRLTFILLAVFVYPAVALEPDNLLLITNKNVPESRKLADFYAAARKLPAGRILELDLPSPDENISFDGYETQVVPVVREYLAKNRLLPKVTCLVTFYGVPLRILPRTTTPAEAAEQSTLRAELKAALDEAARCVQGVESLTREIDTSFLGGGSDKSIP